MKKIALALVIAILLVLCGCGDPQTSDTKPQNTETEKKETNINISSAEDEIVSDAIKVLKNDWLSYYKTNKDNDGYFEIKNTRLIKIKNNDTEMFENVDYIVEFVLFTDYFGSAPYYYSNTTNDTVVVYDDGTMKVSPNLIKVYSGRTYNYKFPEYIDSVTDLGSEYNCIKNLK